MKRLLPVFITILVVGTGALLVIGGLAVYNNMKKSNDDQEQNTISENKEGISTDSTDETSAQDEESSNEENQNSTNDVDLPDATEEDIIRQFFNYIDIGEPDKAVLMMSSEMVGNDPIQANSLMQGYAVTFASWESVAVESVEVVNTDQWVSDRHFYKVLINIVLEDNPPQQTWGNGLNTRWITIAKEGSEWKFTEIATGP